MEKRLIDAKAVLEFLKGFEILHNYDELRSNLIDGIMNLPSVTPQPKIGHWITKDVDIYKCSECSTFNTDKDNYCPNCGARMEVEANEADTI